jgi:GxxExxY protein
LDTIATKPAHTVLSAGDHPEDRLSHEIIGAAIEVHRHLGPGLLESAYETALAHELTLRGLAVRRQVMLPVSYKGVALDDGYRIDLLVDEAVLVEVKAVVALAPIHEAQMLTYLKFADRRLGLLLNFHAATMKDGTKRVVHRL